METVKTTVKRRLSRIKGVCYIPRTEAEVSYPKIAEASEVQQVISDEKSLVEAVNNYLRRKAVADIKAKFEAATAKDSAFVRARVTIKSILEGMQQSNPKATLAEASAAYFAIPGFKEQLEAEGVVFGEPPAEDAREDSDDGDDESDED